MTCENDQTEERLRARGLRPTRARCRILELTAGSNRHFSAEEILHALQEQGADTSPATLYQNLNRLSQEGLLTRFTGPDGLARFDANLEPHHHFVCMRCQRILDVAVDESLLARIVPLGLVDQNPLPELQMDGVQVEFRGVCPGCLGD